MPTKASLPTLAQAELILPWSAWDTFRPLVASCLMLSGVTNHHSLPGTERLSVLKGKAWANWDSWSPHGEPLGRLLTRF